MRIGGFQKFSLIDYPGKMAAIIFTQGCNFRCGYCYNAQLVFPKSFQEPIPEEVVLDFLTSRQGKLQGVVVTGGEPTLQKGLLAFLVKLKRLNFLVKLDTNGSHPEVLEAILKCRLVDFIAMDIKTSLPAYEKAIGVPIDIGRIQESIQLIRESGLPHQFRTTLVKKYCSKDDLKEIKELLGRPHQYVLQAFVTDPNIIDTSLLQTVQYEHPEINALKATFEINSKN